MPTCGGPATLSTTSNILYTIYLLVAGMVDNVLKPRLLLGRCRSPHAGHFAGSPGGIIIGGIISLFTGAVLLAVSYQVFMGWVDNAETDPSTEAVPTEATERAEA
ncbi:MAG: hypothetical protein R2864_11460 [Syntrophotaleaceae bacterium]